jgi:hypothetical protein
LPGQWRVLAQKAAPVEIRPSRRFLQVYRTRIVADFRRERKPDNARKSGLFNNLGALCAQIGLHSSYLRSLTTQPGRPGAIVVLVE